VKSLERELCQHPFLHHLKSSLHAFFLVVETKRLASWMRKADRVVINVDWLLSPKTATAT